MKKCAYCENKIPRKKRNYWTLPCCIMDDSEPVCEVCIKRFRDAGVIIR